MHDRAQSRQAAVATPTFHSLLYREPRLYDLVFPDAGETTAMMVRMAIGRYVPAAPRSILDVGCGTGRHLEALARTIPVRLDQRRGGRVCSSAPATWLAVWERGADV